MHACIHGLMDGWMGGWMDGWMGGGWMDGWLDACIHGYMDGCMGGWMDGWMDGRTDVPTLHIVSCFYDIYAFMSLHKPIISSKCWPGRTDGRMGGFISKCLFCIKHYM